LFVVVGEPAQTNLIISKMWRDDELLPAALSEEQRTLIVACSWYKPSVAKIYH
jgi:hypothetical protein